MAEKGLQLLNWYGENRMKSSMCHKLNISYVPVMVLGISHINLFSPEYFHKQLLSHFYRKKNWGLARCIQH